MRPPEGEGSVPEHAGADEEVVVEEEEEEEEEDEDEDEDEDGPRMGRQHSARPRAATAAAGGCACRLR
jgi:hypothetical protein